jgi:hypothetical protein
MSNFGQIRANEFASVGAVPKMPPHNSDLSIDLRRWAVEQALKSMPATSTIGQVMLAARELADFVENGLLKAETEASTTDGLERHSLEALDRLAGGR